MGDLFLNQSIILSSLFRLPVRGIAADATCLVGNTPMVYINKVTEGCPGKVGTDTISLTVQ